MFVLLFGECLYCCFGECLYCCFGECLLIVDNISTINFLSSRSEVLLVSHGVVSDTVLQ